MSKFPLGPWIDRRVSRSCDVDGDIESDDIDFVVAASPDVILALKAENARLREALLNVARKAEMLKQECGIDPESPQAIRNGRYMHLSYIARQALEAQP